MSGTLKIGGKTLATHDTSSNKLAFHSDANETGQLCRAWVNFNGSTDVIRASYNVSSLTESSGVYTITFTTSMPDSNYSVSGSASAGDNNGKMVCAKTLNSGSVVVVAPYHDNGLVADATNFCVAIFR